MLKHLICAVVVSACVAASARSAEPDVFEQLRAAADRVFDKSRKITSIEVSFFKPAKVFDEDKADRTLWTQTCTDDRTISLVETALLFAVKD